MDYLIKQSRRVKFSTQEDEERPVSNKEKRIQPQKTPSLKEEKNRPQNWFGRQIPWQMNQDYDSNEVEKATAVAAATYVVKSVTNSTFPDKKTLAGHPKPSLTPVKSRKEAPKVSSPQPAPDISKIDSTKIPSLHKKSLEIEEEEELETGVKDALGPSPSVTKTPTITDKQPAIKKVPTFSVSDDQLSTRKQIQPSESLKKKADPVPEIKIPKPDFPATPKPPALSPAKMDRQASQKTQGVTEVDSWERAELAKIKERYEKVEERVVSWENEKKTKSRRRLDKTEREMERKRLKALEKFRSEIEDINQIVDGARSKAKERRRQDELKAKEKANTYRKTGQPPRTSTCFCF